MKNGLKIFLMVGAVLLLTAAANADYLSINAGCDDNQIGVGGGKVYDSDGTTELAVDYLIQYIYAGADGTIDDPDYSDTDYIGGDDELISSLTVGDDTFWGVFSDEPGMFYNNATYSYGSGTAYIYVRAWNAASISSATHYGDSELLTPNTGTVPPIPNDEGIADFSTDTAKPEANTDPDDPTDLAQDVTDGAWVTSGNITFTANMSDADNPEELRLQVQYNADGAGYTGTTTGSYISYTGTAVEGEVSLAASTIGNAASVLWRVRTGDDEGAYSNWVVSSDTFGVDQDAPDNPGTATETGGASDDTWQNEVSDPAFTWSAPSDNGDSGVSGYSIYWGTSSAGEPGTAQEQTTASYDPSAVSGTYYLRVRTFDNAGNYSDASTIFTFKYDGDSPEISSTNPTEGLTSVAIDQSISITFNEAMDTSSVTISCSPDPSGWGTGTWSDGDTVVTYTHTDFDNNTLYAITVTAAQDAVGNDLTGDDDFTFTTIAADAPSISGVEWQAGDDAGYVYGTLEIAGSNFGDDPGEGLAASTDFNVTIDGLIIEDHRPDTGVGIYFWSDTQVVVGVPDSVDGTYLVAGDLTVSITANGAESIGSTFELNPRTYGFVVGDAEPGEEITINGTAYGTTIDDITVTFDSTEAVISAADNTTITATIPAVTGTVSVSVTVNEKDSNSMELTITEPDVATVTEIDPATGVQGETLDVLISGTNTEWSGDMTASISIEPSTGITVNSATGDTTSIEANITIAADATAGDYTITVTDADGSATFTVTEVVVDPILSVDTAELNFSATEEGSNPENQTITISNEGGGILSWTAENAATWLSISPESGAISEGVSENITITVDITGLSADTHTDTITVSSDYGTEEISVALTITDATPSIGSIVWQAGDDSGSVYGTLTITGTNLGDDPGSGEADSETNNVQINGYTLTDYRPESGIGIYYWSDTEIVVGIPPSIEGTYLVAGNQPLTVTINDQTSESVDFELSPNIYGVTESAAIGETISITGTAFGTDAGIVEINFGGTTATPTLVDNSIIEVVVPEGLESGSTVVLTILINGVESGSVDFSVAADAEDPELAVDASSLAFIAYIGGDTAIPGSDTLIISNAQADTGDIAFTITADTDWVTVSPSTGTASDTESATVTVSINLDSAPTDAGTYEAIITVTADDDDVQNSPQEVAVTLEMKEISGPTITTISSIMAPAGTQIELDGSDFGITQGTSQVLFTKDGASTIARVISWSDTNLVVEVPLTANKGTYDIEIYKLTIAAEGIDIASKSDAVSFTVTAAASAGIATIYQNPFDPADGESITIQFNAGSATNIGVYIYDSTARLVSTELLSGTNQTTWDGLYASGAVVGDGVYLVRIVNEDTKALIAKGKALVIKR